MHAHGQLASARGGQPSPTSALAPEMTPEGCCCCCCSCCFAMGRARPLSGPTWRPRRARSSGVTAPCASADASWAAVSSSAYSGGGCGVCGGGGEEA